MDIVHKGSNSESVPALINIANISSVVFGVFLILINHQKFGISLNQIPVLLLSAVVNILLFYITIGRYKIYTPEKALFPFVLAILSTSVLEMVIEHKIYALNEIWVTLGLTILISIICLTDTKNIKLKPNDEI